MAAVKCILGTVVLFTFSVWTEAGILRNSTDQEHELTVSETLELANKDLGGDILTVDGDIAVSRRVRRNADLCVRSGCKWPRFWNGKVYVPYVLDDNYSSSAKRKIRSAMASFSNSTCIRFIPKTKKINKTNKDYLYIQSLEGCKSYVGRKGGAQSLSLNYPNCFTVGTIQHELLHALGFHHEQSRSDRDQYVKVLLENIKEDKMSNFEKTYTLNQGTPYDYNSVMHYSRYLGSKNGLPTMEAVPYPVEFGTATRMSQTDIARVNSLYCSEPSFFNIYRGSL